MLKASISAGSRPLDEIVARFEADWIVRGEADLDAYLPPRRDPRRRAVLAALIRVDRQYRRSAGRSLSSADYRRDYPELGRDDLRESARAGGSMIHGPTGIPSPHAGVSAFRIDPASWVETVDPSSGPTAPRVDFEATARSYLEYRSGSEGPDSGSVDGWAARARSSHDARTVDVMVDLHNADPASAAQVAEAVARMPRPGEVFHGFRIHNELGRGAFGRVYLASQGDLADRPVALKVSAASMSESRTLAQLQHTNIVPIFSSHRVEPYQAVCMPYFGSTTLKDICEDLGDRPSLPTSGRGLVATLEGLREVDPESRRSGEHRRSPGLSSVAMPAADAAAAAVEPAVPALATDPLAVLGRMSYVEAILWIGSKLADGLAHAHGRGILHRDLKPANILLTDSGQPMLLDFNLSEDTKQSASEASYGGTLPYMAPEHLRAFRGGAGQVDARSDIYALGIILYELLAGRYPFEAYPGCTPTIIDLMIAERSGPPPRLRDRNPQVSPAVESIIRHCLQPDPADRYATAAELREDLERHLSNLPLQHAPEPSTRERLAKWSRRHPRLTSSTSAAILIGAVSLGIFGGLMARARELSRYEAESTKARFDREATDARYLLQTRVTDRDRRARGIALGVEALRRYRVAEDPAWRSRRLISALGESDRRALLEQIGILEIFLAGADRLDAEAIPDADPARPLRLRDALRRIAAARECFDPDRLPRAVPDRQADILGLLGRTDEADRARREAAGRPLKTGFDHQVAALDLFLQGRFRDALPPAREATRLAPADFWSWMQSGLVNGRLGDWAEAEACFGTCIALRPDSDLGWFDRAESRLRRGSYDQAIRDYDRSDAIEPGSEETIVGRAVARQMANRPAEAAEDFTRAIAMGPRTARLYFLRSKARAMAGDREGSRADREEAMRRPPGDAATWVLRSMARPPEESADSLKDLDAALAIDPRMFEALQEKAYILAVRSRRVEEAVAILDRAIEMYPDAVICRSTRGVLLAMLGRREAAHRDARESVWRDTSPKILYQVAGIYAVTSKAVPEDRAEALRLLSTALRQGFGFDYLAEDRELDGIRNLAEFDQLLQAAKVLNGPPPDAGGRR